MMGHGMGHGHGAGRGHPDEEIFGSAYDHRVVARLLPYILPYKRLLFLSFATMLVYTATQVAIPWVIMVAIDDYIAESDYAGLTWLFGIFIAIAGRQLGVQLRSAVLHGEGRPGGTVQSAPPDVRPCPEAVAELLRQD